jgi:ubiquinone/menaquinone biosynthesis C-methylase UbiE
MKVRRDVKLLGVVDADFLSVTRESYDSIAANYAEHFRDELAAKPLDRAMLAGFAEFVRSAGGGGPVADVGCGTGHVTTYLHGLGVDVFGIDLSSRMIEMARRMQPQLRFDVGTMTALDIADNALAGLIAYYSIIHIPHERLPQVFAEFSRVLAPGGHALLTFQVGDGSLLLTEALGHAVSLVFHRRQPDKVATLLSDAGLITYARLLREPEDGMERTPQAYLLARKRLIPPPRAL